MEVAVGGRPGSWGTGLTAVAVGTAGAWQKQVAAGVFPRWNRQRASSPAVVVAAVAAVGIAGGLPVALDH